MAIKPIVSIAFMMGLSAPVSGCWWLEEAARERQAQHAQAMDQELAAWKGRSSSDLVEEMGPPTQIIDDASGMRIYVYTKVWNYREPDQILHQKDSEGRITGTTHLPGKSWTDRRHRMYWVDKKGVIVKTAWRED